MGAVENSAPMKRSAGGSRVETISESRSSGYGGGRIGNRAGPRVQTDTASSGHASPKPRPRLPMMASFPHPFVVERLLLLIADYDVQPRSQSVVSAQCTIGAQICQRPSPDRRISPKTQAAAPGNLGCELDHGDHVLDTTEARCAQATLHFRPSCSKSARYLFPKRS